MDNNIAESKVWLFYVGGDSNQQLVENFMLGLKMGVWGSENSRAFNHGERLIQDGDYIIFTCGYQRQKDGPNQNRYRDIETLKKYFLQVNRLALAKVTSNVYKDTLSIWSDGSYPYRFKFELINYFENFSLEELTQIFSENNLETFRMSMIPPVKVRELSAEDIDFPELSKEGLKDVNFEITLIASKEKKISDGATMTRKTKINDDENIDYVESEVDDDYSDDDLYNINSWGADLSFRELVQRYKDGDLLKPEMQRNYVWDKVEASRFIDSILLGLPVPSVFLAKTRDEKMLIVDGYQRIMTVYDFIETGIFRTDGKLFRLTNSEKINTKWRGKAFNELSDTEQRKIKSTTIHSIIFV